MTAPERNCRRFCQVFAAFTGTSFLGIAIVNFVVNPYAQYAPCFLTPMVQTSRAQKVEMVGAREPIPDGLILGSSRVLKLEPDYLQEKTGYTFFNAGVYYGKPEDYLAFLRYYQDRFDRAPRMIVLGADVYAFSDVLPPDARLLNNVSLASRVPEAITLSDRFHRWQELLSWQQTKLSVKSLKIHLTSAELPAPDESFRSDGLLVYHERQSEIASGTYDFPDALDYNKREYRRLFSNFDKISAQRCQLFERFVNTCRANGTQLVVFLTPLHPELIGHLTETTDYRDRKQQVTRYLQRQAAKYRFALWDLVEIHSFAGDPTCFVDGIHPLEPNTRRIIDTILVPQPGKLDYAVQ